MTKPIKITIIFLIVLVLVGEGVYGWNKYEQKISDSNQNKIEIDGTADWLTYQVEDLKISFKYPKEWGGAKISDVGTDTGKSKSINFSNKKDESWALSNPKAGYSTPDASAGRDVMAWESLTYYNLSDVKTCQEFSDFVDQIGKKLFWKISGCQYAKVNDHSSIIFYNGDRSMQVSDRPFDAVIGYYFTSQKDYPVFGIEFYTTDEKEIQEYENIFQLIFQTIKNS